MKRRIALITMCALLSTAPSRGQNDTDSQSTLRGLSRIGVMIEKPTTDLEERGITAFVINAEVVRSLKEGGVDIYDPATEDHPPGSPLLYVVVTAMCDDALDQASYAIRMELVQLVRLDRDAESPSVFATTWGTGGIGVQGKGWRQLLLEDIVRYTEDFTTALKSANPDGGS